MDSQFHMAGEASQSWWKVKEEQRHMLHGTGKRGCAGELPFIKPSDLMRFIHHYENTMGKTHPYDSITSHWVPPTTRGDYDSYNSRWDLGGDTAKLYHSTKVDSSDHFPPWIIVRNSFIQCSLYQTINPQ